MTQPMTRGCNLQLPNHQVILLMAAPVTQEKRTFKPFGHVARIYFDMGYKLRFFCLFVLFCLFSYLFSTPTVKPGLLLVHQDASGLYCFHPTDSFVLRLQ